MQLPRVHWLSEFIVAAARLLSVSYNANTFWFIGIPLGFMIVSALSGWVIGRCHDNGIAVVLLFAIFQFLLIFWSDSSELHRLWTVSLDQSRFRPYLTLLMSYIILDPVAVLLGGFLSGVLRRQRFPGELRG
jgi:hypothetical protein